MSPSSAAATAGNSAPASAPRCCAPSAVSVLGGRLFHPIRDYAEIKEAMLDSAQRSLLLVDHTKFGKSATHAYGAIGQYDRVVTDRGAPAGELAEFARRGVSVEVVDA
ncbi:hypothetical protein ACIGW8_25000 [Streptomyces sioyaensis]|uniref:hypothetical protein n=1 Tax=Streptomyces sioyaensis TaxID=67364 RepID=UPI0037CFAD04